MLPLWPFAGSLLGFDPSVPSMGSVKLKFKGFVSQVGEHISLGICVSQVGEHISLGICVSLVGEHISLGICVSQVGEHI